LADPPKQALPWPPKKEDLEKLYLVEKLSAAKIAKVYGLKHKNPKVAESTVLYQLKRNGIPRRDKAELARKVTVAMEVEWIRRYQAGESLKTIAGETVDPVTVWNHLKARGLVLRDKIEAQINAVTKYERKPFGGDKVEKAYMMGLRYGDLHVVGHGRAIRVRVSTTHPAMAELFESVFAPYAYVHRYPRKAELTGYEWSLECDLDKSFDFLVEKLSGTDVNSLAPDEFKAFLAGFFDAEGSLFLHEKFAGKTPEIAIRNTDAALLRIIEQKIRDMRIGSNLACGEQDPGRFGGNTRGEIWTLSIWRFVSVRLLLEHLPLRHQEKVEKSRIAMRFDAPPSSPRNADLEQEWERLTRGIEESRNEFIRKAEAALKGNSVKYESTQLKHLS
jgi:hypothetical protein